MATDKHAHGAEGAHETHLGVDAWLDTSTGEATDEGFLPAARILAGDDTDESPEN